MMGIALLITSILGTVVQQVATSRPQQAYDPILERVEQRPPIRRSSEGRSAGGPAQAQGQMQNQAEMRDRNMPPDDCLPPQPAFRLGSPYKQGPRPGASTPTPYSPGPHPPIPDSAPGFRI